MSTVALSVDDRVATIELVSPILSRETLHDFAAALDELAHRRAPPPVVLASAHPTVFLAGAHLAEIAELDAATCVPYAARGRSLVMALEGHPAPVVAAVDGSCSGGGFDLVAACDAVVASHRAEFGHPGVRRGLVTGWSGTVRLPSAVGNHIATRLFLGGAPVAAVDLHDTGLLLEVAADPRRAAAEIARRLHRLPASRLRLWRVLRGPSFIDRFRAIMVEKS